MVNSTDSSEAFVLTCEELVASFTSGYVRPGPTQPEMRLTDSTYRFWINGEPATLARSSPMSSARIEQLIDNVQAAFDRRPTDIEAGLDLGDAALLQDRLPTASRAPLDIPETEL